MLNLGLITKENKLNSDFNFKVNKKNAKLNNFPIAYNIYKNSNLENFILFSKINLDGFDVDGIFQKEIINFLDYKSISVETTNLCNCVKVVNQKLYGYNSTYEALRFYLLKKYNLKKYKKILIIGNFDNSSVIINVLKNLNCNYFVFDPSFEYSTFLDINDFHFNGYDLIINNTNVKQKSIKTDYENNVEILDINSELFLEQERNYKIFELTNFEPYFDLKIISLILSQNFQSNNNNYTLMQNLLQIKSSLLNKKILIDGFMGSGKTTFAQKNHLNYIDLDHYIEKKEKMYISKIFEIYGEKHFRNLEKIYFKQLINSDYDVICLGGGFSIHNKNILKEYKDLYYKILIEVDLKQAKLNCEFTNNRPLMKNFEKLFNKRKNKYLKNTDIIISYEHNNCEKMLEKLVFNKLKK